MLVVIADTSPIRYLVEIGRAEILPALFGEVLIPKQVRDELSNPRTPEIVRAWILQPPKWLNVHEAPPGIVTPNRRLHRGEAAALALAVMLHADIVLIDDRSGARTAEDLGLSVAGTLRVLQLAAKRGLLDLRDAFDRISRTNFRYQDELMGNLLDEIEG